MEGIKEENVSEKEIGVIMKEMNIKEGKRTR